MKAQGARGMGAQTVVNWFFKLYLELGLSVASSHSGRRTAITLWDATSRKDGFTFLPLRVF